MPTARSVLLSSSLLQTGNSARLHMNNLGDGAIGGLVLIPYSEILMLDKQDSMAISGYDDIITMIELDTPEFTVIEEMTELVFEL